MTISFQQSDFSKNSLGHLDARKGDIVASLVEADDGQYWQPQIAIYEAERLVLFEYLPEQGDSDYALYRLNRLLRNVPVIAKAIAKAEKGGDDV